MAINYQEELKRLESFVASEGKEYWSPEPAQHKVKALGELENADPFEDDEEQKPRAKLDIEVKGKKLFWGMAIGKTKASTYGQLINLAASKGGKLKDCEFTVVVTGEDRNRRFTIVI